MLHLKLFGTTTLTGPSGEVLAIDACGAKPRQIMEILALSAGPVSKDRLADLLWDEHPPRSYLGTLESYVCLLRRAMGDTRGRASAIRTVTHGYVLDPAIITTDVAQFRALTSAAAGHGSPRAARELMRQAVGLVDGELLASETYAGWAARERHAFVLELAAATTSAARSALALGDLDEAVRMARLALAQDALAEEACRILMDALAASGRRAEAFRAYMRLRDDLEAELGTDPSGATRARYVTLLRDDGAEPGGTGADPDDEVRALVDLLRRAVGNMPGAVRGSVARAIDEVAAELALVG